MVHYLAAPLGPLQDILVCRGNPVENHWCRAYSIKFGCNFWLSILVKLGMVLFVKNKLSIRVYLVVKKLSVSKLMTLTPGANLIKLYPKIQFSQAL